MQWASALRDFIAVVVLHIYIPKLQRQYAYSLYISKGTDKENLLNDQERI